MSITRQSYIRNFSIIAHIDHGKSTIADRLIEKTGTLGQRELVNQVLDDMDLERERGITIKSHAIRMAYKAKDGNEYILNLIDTPGHVDFAYEVSRALAACEGAVLVVDASQGVEAQTFSNLYQALEHDLMIVPVLNKIDLPSARVGELSHELSDLLGVFPEEVVAMSAKNGIGTEDLLEAIVHYVPPPKGDETAPLKALIFDSFFDKYRGVIIYVRVREGMVKKGDRVKFFTHGVEYEIEELGHLRVKRVPVDCLKPGEIGYIIANIKDIQDARVGDTVTTAKNGALEPLLGYKEVKPMVFSGIFPTEGGNYEDLKEALEKLRLNDASFVYEPEVSEALGHGFRAGFLGLLHMKIIQERLEREYEVSIITTAPSVSFNVVKNDGSKFQIKNPSDLPNPGTFDCIEEPFVNGTILVPADYMGSIMKLCQDKRGFYKDTKYIDTVTVELHYELPLAEIAMDFYDKLKSVSSGYASFDYEFLEYRKSDMVKLDILINAEPVDAFSVMIHREKAYYYGRELTVKLKELIPRQMFEVAIQAAVGSKILSRTSVKAMRKDVLAKCYGGDISRKRKLLDKQKEGKKRMRQIGTVEIPQEAFHAVLQIDSTG